MSNPIFPPVTPDIYGPLISGGDVRDAVRSTLDRWSPTYINVIAERTGLALVSPFAAYVATYDHRQLPGAPPGAASYWVTAFAEASEPRRQGGGLYIARHLVEVQIVVYGSDWQMTEDFAHAYGLACRAALVQHGSLGTVQGLASGAITQATEINTRWLRSRYQPVEQLRVSAVGVHQSQFAVTVNGVTDTSAGPKVYSPPVPPAGTQGNQYVTAVNVTITKTGVDGTQTLGQ